MMVTNTVDVISQSYIPVVVLAYSYKLLPQPCIASWVQNEEGQISDGKQEETCICQ